MQRKINQVFNDSKIIKEIQEKLPHLFQLAEIDNHRDGKLGMEVGSARERILIAMLIWVFEEENVKTDTPITAKEIDVILFDEPISIKTFTGKKVKGVKLIWSVDAEKALHFKNNYYPECDILLAQINWNDLGALYLLPKEAQQEVINKIGRDDYFKLPALGTNSRGVEITTKAIRLLVENPKSLKIEINWKRDDSVNYRAYDRWVEMWKEDKNPLNE
jgi:Restriction endonuclease ThaI